MGNHEPLQKRARPATAGRAWVIMMAVVMLAAFCVVGLAGSALAADRWTDITDDQWVQIYKITADEAAQVAGGYPDGTFRPTQAVTRGQFAKMVVDGLGLTQAAPPTPTYPDVLPGSTFYPWIEGAAGANVISGYPDGTYGPAKPMMRQGCNALLGRYLSAAEVVRQGAIQGAAGSYATLAAWFAAEGESYLAQFADESDLVAVHRPTTAYLVYRGVVSGAVVGGQKYLRPTQSVTRAQAVAMVTRTAKAAADFSGPSVTLLSPTSGPVAGGTQVTITGTGFSGATAVTFGGSAASFTVDSATQIRATAPAHAAGVVDVRVTAGGAASPNTAADDYTYVSPAGPTVTALNPTSGSTTGGNQVVITGTNLTGATAVAFGTTTLTSGFTVNSATQITVASAPAHAAGTVHVTVTTPGGTSPTSTADRYTYMAAPTVTKLEPTNGPITGGNTVTITGTGFTGATAVSFGTTAAVDFDIESDTEISAVAPAHSAGVVHLTVTTPYGTSATSSADQYTYLSNLPTVTDVTPDNGPTTGGNQVVITGTNLTGATAVSFGTTTLTNGFTVDSATQITVASAPAHSAGLVHVTVTTAVATSTPSSADRYTYVGAAAPAVTSLDPTRGPTSGGNEVMITGSNFTGATAVTFGATALTSGFTVDSATQITVASAPDHAAGSVDVTVTTPNGTSANTDADDYTYVAPPAITRLEPSSGPTAGDTTVTITGSGLLDATEVRFGSTPAKDFDVDSDTQITAVSPSHDPGAVDVSVTTPYGTSSNTGADNFTYTAPLPVVTDVSPDSGPSVGSPSSVKVTITGTNLAGATVVSFGGTNAASFTVNSDTKITVNGVPARSPGTVHVTVTTPAGASTPSSADEFLYYYFMMVSGSTSQTYTLSDLQGMSSVSGYGGFLNTYPSFKGPWYFTGVTVLSLLADVGGFSSGHSVRITASDGYVKTFTYDQVANNNFTMYDPSSDPADPVTIGPGDITGSLDLILAYEQDGSSMPLDPGPLRIAIVSPESGQQATDSVLWVKMVVKIEVL